MPFGFCYEASEDERYTDAERHGAMLDLVVYGETLGFDAV
jgi:hypothetical protein